MKRRRVRKNPLIAEVNVLEAELTSLKAKLNKNSGAKDNQCNGCGGTNTMDIAKEVIKKCFE